MSAPKITLDEVYRVARLARLSPSPEEAQALCQDLSAILNYVALLDAVDTSQVEPTANAVTEAAALRPDQLTPSLDRELALSQAPRANQGGFSVPKVLEVES
ncbi:MAG: Asp-tRNA(Asn)/Glu-tRNA(Gln) amidotransferase subunit GatC [Myxococcales bacterium]